MPLGGSHLGTLHQRLRRPPFRVRIRSGPTWALPKVCQNPSKGKKGCGPINIRSIDVIGPTPLRLWLVANSEYLNIPDLAGLRPLGLFGVNSTTNSGTAMAKSNQMLDISGFLQGLEIELPKSSSTKLGKLGRSSSQLLHCGPFPPDRKSHVYLRLVDGLPW